MKILIHQLEYFSGINKNAKKDNNDTIILMDFSIDEIINNIKQIFIDEASYSFDKHIWEYKPQEKFVGDSMTFTMVEPTTPPTFYYVISPFDNVSNKAPQHALVFKEGKLLFSTDYTDYAAMRTGAMDTLVLQTLGIETLKDKKILMFGKGSTATWSQKFLKHFYSDTSEITIVDSQTPKDSFNISDFDIIICHTNTKQFLLTSKDKDKIKKGAIITNYISSESNTEIPPEIFDSESANIIIDWKPNLKRAPEIKENEELIELKDLLKNTKKLNETKNYSIFRFLGTPLQNLAVLKTLTSR